jgi:putative NIF3 family GTP cyclohydrolase 1 type 2
MLLSLFIDFLEKFNKTPLSGFQLGPSGLYEKKTIKGIVFSLFPEMNAAIYTRKLKSNLIICLYPLFNPSLLFQIDEFLHKMLFFLLKHHIWLYYLNTPSMICEILGEVLCYSTDRVISTENIGTFGNLLKTYTYSRKTLNFDEFLADIKRKLAIGPFRFIKANNPSFDRISFIYDDCSDENLIKKLNNLGCTCLITDTLNHYWIRSAKKFDLSVIELPLTAIYKPWIRKLVNIIALNFPRLPVSYFDSGNIISTYR